MTLACRVACVCRGNGGEGRGGGEGVGPAVGKLWECSKSRPTWSEPLRQPWLRTHSAFRPRSFFFGQGNNKKVNFVLFCFVGAYWGDCDVSVVFSSRKLATSYLRKHERVDGRVMFVVLHRLFHLPRTFGHFFVSAN